MQQLNCELAVGVEDRWPALIRALCCEAVGLLAWGKPEDLLVFCPSGDLYEFFGEHHDFSGNPTPAHHHPLIQPSMYYSNTATDPHAPPQHLPYAPHAPPVLQPPPPPPSHKHPKVTYLNHP
ncbi:hypothetical protein LguiB_016554 [Lonicera macranthoides]